MAKQPSVIIQQAMGLLMARSMKLLARRDVIGQCAAVLMTEVKLSKGFMNFCMYSM
jgi:hypothetical protein